MSVFAPAAASAAMFGYAVWLFWLVVLLLVLVGICVLIVGHSCTLCVCRVWYDGGGGRSLCDIVFM